jgi:16S rRNA (uracil1498-N3)-methyltransferase
VVKLSGERAEKRLAHWQRTVVAASEQCGRNRLARVEDVTDFSRWIEQPTDGIRLMLSPRAKMSLSQWVLANPPQAVTFMIGPEGGFAPEEEDLAISQGALPLSMGPRVLRTETAGIAALATLNAVWSEI